MPYTPAVTYTVKELFDTLQGEGARAGARSIFIRLAGCNYWNGKPEGRGSGTAACSLWCDTDFVGGEKLSVDQIVSQCEKLWPTPGDRWVVFTGGEPLLQLDDALIVALHRADFQIAVETNGSQPAPVGLDWVTVSPKMAHQNVGLAVAHGQELKVVLPGAVDGDGWHPERLESLRINTTFDHYYVQPQDPIDSNHVSLSHLTATSQLPGWFRQEYQANLARCIEFVKCHPQWMLSLQTHKWMGLR